MPHLDLQQLAFWSPCIQDIIHVANVLYLLSYSVRDILWLRVLTVVAALCLLPYYYSCGADPLWAPIIWNLLFTSVNLFQIFLLVKERWPRSLQGLERRIYDEVFSALTPGEFVKLVQLGAWREDAPGTVLVRDGSVVQEMTLLCEGTAEVRRGDTVLAKLAAGQFVGEMSFLTQEKAGADVVTTARTKVLSWPQDELQRFLERHGDMSFKVRGVLGRDLVQKLRRDTPPAAPA